MDTKIVVISDKGFDLLNKTEVSLEEDKIKSLLRLIVSSTKFGISVEPFWAPCFSKALDLGYLVNLTELNYIDLGYITLWEAIKAYGPEQGRRYAHWKLNGLEDKINA